MSWDLFILNIPLDIRSTNDLPNDDTELPPLGTRKELTEKIISFLPETNFDDPSWGIYSTPTFQLEFNMGTEEICSGIMIHLRGDYKGLTTIDHLLQQLGLRGIDMQRGEFFTIDTAQDSLKKFESLKNRFLRTKKKVV